MRRKTLAGVTSPRMRADSYGGYRLTARRPASSAAVEHWWAEGPDGPAEVYLGPEMLVRRARALPIWGPFPEILTGREGLRWYVVVKGRMGRSVDDLRELLSPGACVAFAWHLAAALGEVHDRGGAHGALHPGWVGVDAEGHLCIRPALTAAVRSDPDSEATAQSTDCLQFGAILDALELERLDEPNLGLLMRGIARDRARLRLQPGRAVRQAFTAILNRHPDWTTALVDTLGPDWQTSQIPRSVALLPSEPARPWTEHSVHIPRVTAGSNSSAGLSVDVRASSASARAAGEPARAAVMVPVVAASAAEVPSIRADTAVRVEIPASRDTRPRNDGGSSAGRASVAVPSAPSVSAMVVPPTVAAPAASAAAVVAVPAAVVPRVSTTPPAVLSAPPAPALAPPVPLPPAPATPVPSPELVSTDVAEREPASVFLSPDLPSLPDGGDTPVGGDAPVEADVPVAPLAIADATPAVVSELAEPPGEAPSTEVEASSDDQDGRVDEVMEAEASAPGSIATPLAVDPETDRTADAPSADAPASEEAPLPPMSVMVTMVDDGSADDVDYPEVEEPPTNITSAPPWVQGVLAEAASRTSSSATTAALDGEARGIPVVSAPEPTHEPDSSVDAIDDDEKTAVADVPEPVREALRRLEVDRPVAPRPLAPAVSAAPHLAADAAPTPPAPRAAQSDGDSAPLWASARGVTGDDSRDRELGTGKWEESARPLDELRREMGASPVRPMEDIGPSRGSWPMVIVALAILVGLVALWFFNLR